jgi:hypothetical protein
MDEKITNIDELFDALKIYNLTLGYRTSENSNLWVGRRINDRITNIGAIDGIQYSQSIRKNYEVGGFIGTRPDYSDYRISFALPQAGLYLAHFKDTDIGSSRTTLSFVEQRSGSNTDRRFMYFQHSNSLINKVHIFSSFELDLYKFQLGQATSTIRPTSLYISIRYRPNRYFSVFGAYDNRRRIIYYESYKSFIDQLLEEETRQGYRLRIQIKPIKRVYLSVSGMYRFQQNNTPTRNLNASLNISRIPYLKISSIFTFNYLETSYLQGNIFGFRTNRDIIRGKLSGTLNYRFADYIYNNSETTLQQHIAGIALSLRLSKSISLSINYEGNFQENRNYNRFFVNAVKRFR